MVKKYAVQNVDRDFIKLINRIKGERMIREGIEVSFAQITREIAQTQEFGKLVNELSKSDNNIKINIRVDKKRL